MVGYCKTKCIAAGTAFPQFTDGFDLPLSSFTLAFNFKF